MYFEDKKKTLINKLFLNSLALYGALHDVFKKHLHNN